MKLTYTVATQSGYVDNGAARGSFVQALTPPFSCDMFWYDPRTGEMFYGNGRARTNMSAADRAAVAGLIATISIDG